jgi:DNA recombination protein RmuC
MVLSIVVWLFVIGSALACLITYLFFSNKVLLNKNKVLFEENNSLSLSIKSLSEDKLRYLQKIQELLTTLEFKKEQEQNKQAYHNSFENVAQQTIIKLGSELTKQLLESYTHQAKNTQMQSEAQVKATTSAIISQIDKLVQSTNVIEKEMQKSTGAVDELKRSLLSSSSVGGFAELTLQNILTASGLQRNVDFYLQLTLQAEDKTHRPDVIVRLPEDNFIIIDAKASKFFLESDLADKTESIGSIKASSQNLLKAMNAHVKSLASKEYQNSLLTSFKQNNNIDCNNITTLMFVHSEALIEKINSLDTSFLEKAWKLNIFPVGPTGMMNVLSISKRYLNQKKQVQNYAKILDEIKLMLNSLNVLAEHANKLGSSVYSLVANYDRFAASFNHNFLSKSNKVSSLGITDTKTFNNSLLTRYNLATTQTNVIELDKKSDAEIYAKHIDKKSIS